MDFEGRPYLESLYLMHDLVMLAKLKRVVIVRLGFHGFGILLEVYIVEDGFLGSVGGIYRRRRYTQATDQSSLFQQMMAC